MTAKVQIETERIALPGCTLDDLDIIHPDNAASIRFLERNRLTLE